MELSIVCYQHEVEGILAGRQTQLRRVMKEQPRILSLGVFSVPTYKVKYISGDQLWVREAWQHCPVCGYQNYLAYVNKGPHCQHCDASLGKWKLAICMFREYSRITLEVVKVRVEQVQDISPNDCYAEGVRTVPSCQCEAYMPGTEIVERGGTADERYQRVIQTIWDIHNAKRGYSWQSNPWVRVVEFKVLNAPAYGNH